MFANDTRKKRSGTYAIFKGTGAAKFTQIWPQYDDRGFVAKNGAILLEAAPVVGKREDGLPLCDWDQKITFAIGIQDVAQLLDPTVEKLFHKNDDVVKTLSFVPGQGRYEGTYQMNISQKRGEQLHRVFIPFSAGEFAVLQRLLVSSTGMMLGWQ